MAWLAASPLRYSTVLCLRSDTVASYAAAGCCLAAASPSNRGATTKQWSVEILSTVMAIC